MEDVPFDASGNLPRGVHHLFVPDIRARFGAGSPRREWLAARLDELLAVCDTTGKVKRVILWGSFVFRADVFWVRETIGQDMIDLIPDTYQVARDKRCRGIVEVLR